MLDTLIQQFSNLPSIPHLRVSVVVVTLIVIAGLLLMAMVCKREPKLHYKESTHLYGRKAK